MKCKLSDVIDSKVNSARNAMRGVNTGPIARIKFRSHENYQSEHCWRVYAETGTSNSAKLCCMATHMLRLGISPQVLDEQSIAEAATLCLHTISDIDPNFWVTATRRLRVLLRGGFGPLLLQLPNTLS